MFLFLFLLLVLVLLLVVVCLCWCWRWWCWWRWWWCCRVLRVPLISAHCFHLVDLELWLQAPRPPSAFVTCWLTPAVDCWQLHFSLLSLVDGMGSNSPALQILISHILRYRNNRAAAAGIAGLVGNCSISEAGDASSTVGWIMFYHEELSQIHSARATHTHTAHTHTQHTTHNTHHTHTTHTHTTHRHTHVCVCIYIYIYIHIY